MVRPPNVPFAMPEGIVRKPLPSRKVWSDVTSAPVALMPNSPLNVTPSPEDEVGVGEDVGGETRVGLTGALLPPPLPPPED